MHLHNSGTVQVLSHVSARLADMHEAGYVHRDLKPANVMWLPRENRWTVIDFGCTARTGHRAALAFTLTYAAPEVVRAFVAQERHIEAAPAVDAWALGVMAFELLTRAPAFQPLTHGCHAVRSPATTQSHCPGPLPEAAWHAHIVQRVLNHSGKCFRPHCQLGRAWRAVRTAFLCVASAPTACESRHRGLQTCLPLIRPYPDRRDRWASIPSTRCHAWQVESHRLRRW